MIYHFERRGRRPAAIYTVFAIWAALFSLWVGLNAAWWFMLIIGAFTLPALWDIWRDTLSTVEIHKGRIVWSSALGRGDHTDIDHVRINRRLNGGFRISLVHGGGATTRLPADLDLPVDPFETALNTAGIATQRHPFSII